MFIVQCDNLSKIYQQGNVKVHALDGVSLTVKKGEFLSLFGPSGSGKTTLLNIIGGLDVPSGGSVTVNGQALEKLSASSLAEFRLHQLGFVFQAYNLIPVLTAIENVEFVMQLQGVPSSERGERARQVLKEVGLENLEQRRPGELSGGQQQRVAIARAIASHPAIILADEPTANLDSKTAENLMHLMLQMNIEHKVTFIFSTHDPLVMEHAKRLVGLKDGKIVSDREQ